jgi:hypothetical protein
MNLIKFLFSRDGRCQISSLSSIEQFLSPWKRHRQSLASQTCRANNTYASNNLKKHHAQDGCKTPRCAIDTFTFLDSASYSHPPYSSYSIPPRASANIGMRRLKSIRDQSRHKKWAARRDLSLCRQNLVYYGLKQE